MCGSVCRSNWLWYSVMASIFSMASYLLFTAVAPREPHCDIDSKAYLEKAQLMYTTGSFYDAKQPELPYYGLGYAFIMSCAYRVAGQSVPAIIFLQLLLALMTFGLIAGITRQLFGAQAQKYALILCSLNLGYLVFTQFILTEITLAFFLALFFYCFIRAQSWRDYLLAGLVLGASLPIKAAGIYFIIPLVILLLVMLHGRYVLRLKYVLALVLGCAIIPAGYTYHNIRTFGTAALGNMVDVNLYYWFYPYLRAELNQTTTEHERRELIKKTQGDYAPDKLKHEFWSTVISNPVLTVKLWGMNVMKSMLGLYTSNLKVLVENNVRGGDISFFKTQGSLLDRAYAYVAAGATHSWVIVVGLLEAFLLMITYVLCLVALGSLYRHKRYFTLMTIVLFFAYFFAITGHDVCARFRMMVEFLLIACAAGGLERVAAHHRSLR